MTITKKTWIFILLCTGFGFLAQYKAYSQNESGKFDFYLKANLGPLFNKNANDTPFESQVTSTFGSHLIARYNFSKLGLSAGIGGDNYRFSQRIDFGLSPGRKEYSTFEMSYFALGIPVLVHYSLTDRFEINGGVNLIGANWLSYSISSDSNGSSGMTAHANENIPDWQFTQEVMAGLNYKLSERFDLGISVAKSLKNIEGMGIEMELSAPDQDDLNVSEKFDYSWTRFSFEVAYKLNK